jgi:leader peptidase (prepilin peptidase) / N-methyltransferase
VVAYRIIQGVSLAHPRFFCPTCKNSIAWYDTIPVLSWILLKGKCRFCKGSISLLYPFIEILTALVLTALYLYINPLYFVSYFIFFSALIVTIRTDLETMLISRYMTIALIPVGVIASAFSLLPISLYESLSGALIGYFVLFLIERGFFFFTKKHGMGQGDLDLACFIGSFVGPLGCWITLTLAALTGSCIGIVYLLANNASRDLKIPFGPFLSLSAIAFVFLESHIIFLFFPHLK